MTLNEIIVTVTEFVNAHEKWALPIIFFLAFGESLAFLSLLLPATVILLGVGALIGEGGLSFFPVFIAAATGAFLGDWVSYYVGYYYKDGVKNLWPISRSPQMLVTGHKFFEKWGVWGVFIGRFFGPLRAVIPLVAGICAMPQRYFQLANFFSALVWAFGMLAPGAFGLQWLGSLMD